MKLPLLSVMLLIAAPGVGRTQDLETNYKSLQDAVAKSDAEAVKKLAAATSQLACQAAAEPAPQAADDKDAWSKRVAYANDIETYSEYALFSVAVKSQPATEVDLLAALETQNPKSKYLDDAYAYYLYALTQAGQSAKIPAMAEKALANFPENPDLLLYLTDHERAARQSDRAQAYATRLVAAAGKRSKPEGMSDADWATKKATFLAHGYEIAGAVAGEKQQWVNADRNLRAALPYLGGNNVMKAEALFYLGMANYYLGKMTLNKAKVLEGAKFSDQCAAITSPYTQQAWTNSANMKKEAATMR